MTRGPFHQRAGARLPSAGGVTRPDGSREATRHRTARIPECFRCAEEGATATTKGRVLKMVRIVAGGTTLGTALFCNPCLGELEPLDPDPLTVVEGLA